MSATTAGRPDGQTAKQGPIATPAVRPSGRPAVLESRAYNFWYGPTQALHGIDLSIPPRSRDQVTA